jgi:sugar phosphate isomerase/epimerase
MIYVSSACVRHEKIANSVEALALAGFLNIELSGGTVYYPSLEEDLLRLKQKYGLNYLLHNYFPPPPEDFILNLASLDDDIYRMTITHYLKALDLSRKLGASKFGLHAGYLINVHASEVGKKIMFSVLNDRTMALERFCEGFLRLKSEAVNVELYVENNVLSATNARTYYGQRPFMLLDYEGYLELQRHVEINVLLDVAHLRVTATSLGLNFEDQLGCMLPLTDYVHLSDNDGAHDQNLCFSRDSALLKILKRYNLCSKTLTIETYAPLEAVSTSLQVLKDEMGLD